MKSMSIFLFIFLDEILSILDEIIDSNHQIVVCMDETMFMDEIDDIGN
jgi:hypothetical protein